MKFVSRLGWGAVAPRVPWTYVASNVGVKIHYEGTHVSTGLLADHTLCTRMIRDIQASHMADREQRWTDIAYSAMVCPHGYIFEGRGAHARCGANGNSTLNAAHYAVCAMVGDSGLTEPTPEMLGGLRDAVDWLRRDGGAGAEIKGHRDGYATSCPGGPLYRWVQQGAPRPTAGDDMTPEDLLNAKMPWYAAVPDGAGNPYTPTVGEVLNGAKLSDKLIEALPGKLLDTRMPEWAAVTGGDGKLYVPTVAEVLNGAKTADAQLAKLAVQLTAQTAAVTALAVQLGNVHGVDTAAVVAAVETAIERAVVQVDVHVSGA